MTENTQTDQQRACYLFEAKSIQSYLFSTNRLREIVGGSEMIENITGEDGLLDNLTKDLDTTRKLKYSRKGGGAFYVFSDPKTIEILKNAWSLLFQLAIPNMSFNHASATATDDFKAFEEAQSKLLASRNKITARMPQATPYTLRFNRTGEPVESKKGKGNEAIDIATEIKLKYAEGESLIKRFDTESTSDNWPIYLTPEPNEKEKNFPFNDDTQNIALIHADGNGFGQLLMTLKDQVKNNAENFIELFADFSKAISTATENAAQKAVKKVLAENKKDDPYPARPIVLGGDDLTIIVRADLAIAFTQVFLSAFEVESEDQLSPLQDKYKLNNIPTKLTACAGITFAKASHPFHMMHDLSEALCSAAKQASKCSLSDGEITPSSLVFHRITTSLVDDYANIVSHELTAGGQILTRGAYAIRSHRKLPLLDDLIQLVALFKNEENSSNALREVQSLLENDKEEAETRYKRWLEIIEKASSFDNRASTMKEDYLELMGSLIESKETGSNKKKAENFSAIKEWPLNDLLSLKAVKTEVPQPQTKTEGNTHV